MSAATKKSDDQVSTTKKRPRSETPSGTTEASGDEANKKTKMDCALLPSLSVTSLRSVDSRHFLKRIQGCSQIQEQTSF